MMRGSRKNGDSLSERVAGLRARMSSERPADDTRDASSRIASSSAARSGTKTLAVRMLLGSEPRESGVEGIAPSGRSPREGSLSRGPSDAPPSSSGLFKSSMNRATTSGGSDESQVASRLAGNIRATSWVMSCSSIGWGMSRRDRRSMVSVSMPRSPGMPSRAKSCSADCSAISD